MQYYRVILPSHRDTRVLKKNASDYKFFKISFFDFLTIVAFKEIKTPLVRSVFANVLLTLFVFMTKVSSGNCTSVPGAKMNVFYDFIPTRKPLGSSCPLIRTTIYYSEVT